MNPRPHWREYAQSANFRIFRRPARCVCAPETVRAALPEIRENSAVSPAYNGMAAAGLPELAG